MNICERLRVAVDLRVKYNDVMQDRWGGQGDVQNFRCHTHKLNYHQLVEPNWSPPIDGKLAYKHNF